MSTAREELSKRILPLMELSSGFADSNTAPPPPISRDATSAERAALRFAVSGNAIVTGGAGTLGLASARALLEHGLSGLMIFDVNTVSIGTAVDQLKTEFPQASIDGVVVDITDEAAVSLAVAGTASKLGPVNILLCFAGIVDCAHALNTPPAQWRRVLDVNTTGTFIVAQAVAAHMVELSVPRGSIIFIASISGHRVNYPQPQASYNVSKAAVITLKNTLAAEWACYGIRVNSISPGYMDTILNEGEGLKTARDTWTARNPMGRMGQPEELTGTIVLLASQAGSYINGADVVVDGGQIFIKA